MGSPVVEPGMVANLAVKQIPGEETTPVILDALGVYIARATNLATVVRIGNTKVKCVLDTGAAKSFIRTAIGEGLYARAGSQNANGPKQQIINHVRCKGVEGGRSLPKLDNVRDVYVTSQRLKM